jgi:chorismate synthase
MGRATITFRELHTAEELAVCEALERHVWGLEDLDILPTSHLVASVHAGGLVLGAFAGEAAVGFAYGFPAYLPEKASPLGFHSHMLAVVPEARGQGIGQRLKWQQRAWCLARGLPWMTWTFDPLQMRNAKLNLEHLGATVGEYRPNEYGEMGGSLNAGLPSDRLLAFWELAGARVERLAAGRRLDAVAEPEAIPELLARGASGEPLPLDPGEARRVRVALPESINTLLKRDPDLALAWRLAVRAALAPRLAAGWRITRYVRDGYVMEDGNQLM